MPKKADKSSVTVWNWFLTILVMSIPCIGFIYVICGAFFANNESRKNFFRAHLAWLGVIIAIYASLFAVGFAPDLKKFYDQYRHELAAKTGHSAEQDSTPGTHKKSAKKPADSD
jgi:hypothetical protein